MKISKGYWILIVIGILVLSVMFLRFFIGGSEDSWIKDERGIYVKHGNPAETPDYVKEQQDLIKGVLELYNSRKASGMVFSSQCLGRVDGYAVDVVHVPRIAEDDLIENQCQEYRNGNVKHFIELDKDGNIVRVE